MTPRWARVIAVTAGAAWLAAGMFAGTGVAKADGVIDRAEQWDGDTYGAIYCGALDRNPDRLGVNVIAGSIMDDGFDGDSTADIINYTVYNYCPRHWPLIVAIGEAARGPKLVYAV